MNGIDHRLDLKMMEVCLGLAEFAAQLGEIPVGAVVVSAGKIVAEGHNLCEQTCDPTAHAERLVITAAAQAHRSWRLDGCTLYSTLEPCVMCAGAIVQGRIARLVYGASDLKAGACRSLARLVDDPRLNHRAEVTAGVLADPCRRVLSQFFAEQRQR